MLLEPLPLFIGNNPNKNFPSAFIEPYKALPPPEGMSYNTSPEANLQTYWAAFVQSEYKSLRELVLKTAEPVESSSVTCGITDPKGPIQPLPKKVKWDGFDGSHKGPCEVWCDDTLVFMDNDCSTHYTEKPATLYYVKDLCKGKKILMTVWIAVHLPPWQVYQFCVPIDHSNDD